jgi:hypothetical protein
LGANFPGWVRGRLIPFFLHGPTHFLRGSDT